MPEPLPPDPLWDVLDLSAVRTFPEILARLWQTKFKGSVTFHFVGGLPRAVELSQTVQVPLGKD